MVGFAAFLLIFLVIQYEKSFDDFHANKNNIYRVVRIGKNPVNREYRTGVPFPVTFALRNEFPQLNNAAAISGDNNVQVNITAADGSIKKNLKKQMYFTANRSFSKCLIFLWQQVILNAINEPNTVLLTKDIAAKYFGNWKWQLVKRLMFLASDMKVTGILNNPPANTDFPLSSCSVLCNAYSPIQI